MTAFQDMTINEIIALHPASVEVFQRHGMDSCCGGALPVLEAAQRHGVDREVLLAELATVAEGASPAPTLPAA
jgi:regulator of cell morphogenesis and NO signaling